MKRYIVLLVLICLCLCSSTTFASSEISDNLLVKYDILNSSLVIDADFGSSYGDVLTSISVYEVGASFNDSSVPPVLKTAFTDKNGKLYDSITIPASFESDKYTVKISNKSGTYNKDFLYAKASDIRSVMISLNSAETIGEISDIIESNYTKLALDPMTTTSHLSELSCAYHEICSNIDYTDEKLFYSDFMQCLAAAEIANGNDVTAVLKNYKIYIGTCVDDIETYPQKVKELLLSYISNSKYEDGFLAKQIPELRTFAFFKSSATVDEAKFNILGVNTSGDKYINNFDVLSPDLTYYSQVKNVNLVYQNIFLKSSSITNITALKTEFENASKIVYEQENQGNNSGSGSFGGSPSIPTATYNPVTAPQQGSQSSVFSDVKGHWAQKQIEELVAQNVISGYPDGTFAPNKNVSRAEFIKMIMSYSGLTTQSDSVSFDDVTPSDWFYPYISSAVNYGYINGISDSMFAPNTEITRQDACVIIYRYLGSKVSYDKIASFTDYNLISDYASEAVSALSQNGIITGYEDNSFKAQKPITRAETAVIISRVTEYLK